jgi:hypothetical protein
MLYIKRLVFIIIVAIGIVLFFGHYPAINSGNESFAQGKDCQGLCGDSNGDGRVNIPDLVYLYNYIFLGGPPMIPIIECGDADYSGSVNISDLMFVMNFIFGGGSSPLCTTGGDCCEYTGQGPALTFPNDPGVRDTVIASNVNVNSSATEWVTFEVPVRLVNDEEIHAACLGFTFESADLTIDSISSVGSCLEGASLLQNNVWPESNLAVIGFSRYNEYILPGDNLISTLWFSLAPNTPDQIIIIDSASFGPAGDFLLAQSDGTHLIPVVVSGTVTVGTGGQPEYQCGDVNCDDEVNISDAVWLINWIFIENAPGPCECKK